MAATPHAGASRIQGSVNIPLHELHRRMAEVPAGEIWVHRAAWRAVPGLS